jgi:hypothetical protein
MKHNLKPRKMKAIINTGTYKVTKIGGAFFATFIFNDNEVLFLSHSYGTEKGATKRLQSHCKSANIQLT